MSISPELQAKINALEDEGLKAGFSELSQAQGKRGQ